MTRRRTAAEIETAAARRGARPTTLKSPGTEAIGMLLRRGMAPRLARRDVPFPPDLDDAAADRIAERMRHYGFRLFLRGAILAGAAFRPPSTTRYLSAPQATQMAEELVALGLAARAGVDGYRLRWRARNFGGTLEWWVGRELRRLGFDVATGVRSGAPGIGGDLDVVATAEGKLLYVELKSSPPKHIAASEVAAFFGRVRALRPDLTVFGVDTALRLSDKVLPMLVAELERGGKGSRGPRRVARDNWEIAPHVYAVNARQDFIENIRLAIADGLLSLGPPVP